MDRSWGILAAFSLLLAVSACGPDESPAPPASSSSSKPSPSSTPPTFTPTVSPAKVTAACPFLGADELNRITGTTADTVAQEEAPGTTEDAPQYTCAYLTGQQLSETAPRLYFFALDQVEPDIPVSSTAENCPTSSTPLPGVGDAAMYCALDNYWTTIAIAKRVHGETRMVNLHLHEYPKDVYVRVAKLLAERL
ncbi:hypothetical protein [Amycolatopsis pittospori]|uniref:hypothetical protein n=1 Tax=Amycolatopsis pittospori TaxID=2749434 RepID=UPI0015F06768|nr:hypothetical protein [Amycolatopsis pittospori]